MKANIFKIGVLEDNLSGSLDIHNYWLQNYILPWNTLNLVPADCVDFIQSFELDYMPGYANYKNQLQMFQDVNFAVSMINSFPDITNPTKDVIVKGVQALLAEQNEEIRDVTFNLLKDTYAIPLLIFYYSKPEIINIPDIGKRLQAAVQMAFLNYQNGLKSWNDARAAKSKSWITSALGSLLSVIPFVGNTLASVFSGITGSLSSVKLTTPNGNTFAAGQNGLAVNLAGGKIDTTTMLLYLGIGAGVLMLLFGNKKTSKTKK